MINDLINTLVPLGLAFIAYFVMHSLLASLWVKNTVQQHWPHIMPAYRLLYNFIAVLFLIPLVLWMQANPGPPVWLWQGAFGWLMNGLTLSAIVGFLWSLRAYDNSVFLGLTQWRNRHRAISSTADPEQLHLSTQHRFVRHPWYFFFLVIMWTQDLHLTQVVVYGLITVYLFAGSRMEEQKLIEHYGEAYENYQKQVPGLFPLPWRWLSKNEANYLVALAAKGNPKE